MYTVEVKLSVEAYWKNSEAPLLKQGHFSFPKSTLPLSLFIVLKPDHLKKSLTNIAQLCSLCPPPLTLFITPSKHLKGRFGPRVSNGNVFGPKEVSLGPVLVTVTFLDQRRSVWAPC